MYSSQGYHLIYSRISLLKEYQHTRRPFQDRLNRLLIALTMVLLLHISTPQAVDVSQHLCCHRPRVCLSMLVLIWKIRELLPLIPLVNGTVLIIPPLFKPRLRKLRVVHAVLPSFSAPTDTIRSLLSTEIQFQSLPK